MAGSDYLFDTNIIVAILNQEPGLEERLSRTSVYISSVVLGELYFGVYRSKRVADNLVRLEAFLVNYAVLGCDKETAAHYGQIKSLLQAEGRPVPDNDIWIAALAKQHNLTLVSRDEHFNYVEGLLVEEW